mmetsp:Transcript_108654/g.171442  ORF Transcript_108654/g.171442 Transcript_108654/m.171442 type:complete len:150 (+) Transcript_108654:63-512(+)
MAQDMMTSMFQQMITNVMSADESEKQRLMGAMMQGMQQALALQGKGANGKGGDSKGSGGKGKSWAGKIGGGISRNPDRDMVGKPGPNGEDPETGRWTFSSAGTNAGKKWKWKRFRTAEEIEAKRAKNELEGLLAQFEDPNSSSSSLYNI